MILKSSSTPESLGFRTRRGENPKRKKSEGPSSSKPGLLKDRRKKIGG